MAGRRSVWSDPRLIAMAARFVPAADEVWRLQRGSDADCRFFQRMVNGGELITDRGSRQGIWVAAPSGRLLARINSLNPDAVLKTLERGLAAWEALPEKERALAPDSGLEPEHRWEHSVPKDGLVLERFARDLPPSGLPSAERGRAWNADYAWFSADEVRAWLPAEPTPGAVRTLPGPAARRLARFHLVDNVSGQTLPFADDEILAASIELEVLARRGELVDVELRGSTRSRALGPWLLGENLWKPGAEHARGMETTLFGRGTWSLAGERFTDLEILALGRRWGRSQFNGRRDETPGRTGFHFGLAAESSPRVAPTFVAVYDAAWIAQPTVPSWR